MPSSPLSVVVRQLRAAAERDGAGRTDGELLTCFLSQRDEDALAALVVRHAPMVWGVCRRLLRNPHDAEDAFQAAFLVLVRKAATVTPREMVGNWLYGVAHQTAVRLRATAAKRGVREVQMKETPEPAVAEVREEELLSLLDQELSRLPERFRVLIVLCDLEGKTRKEVARRLGCPEGTVASRHARARGMLAKRMARHGLAVSGGALAAVLAQTAASASAPTTVVSSTIKAATLLATGKAVGVISGPVAALTEGVLKAMFLKKIMTTTVMVLALSMAAVTFGSLAKGQAEGQTEWAERPMDKRPMADKKPMETEKEGFTAWGKEAGGLQAGLGYLPGEHRIYHIGEAVTLVVRVRNVNKEAVKFQYLPNFFMEKPPTVTDGEGKPVPFQYGVFDLATVHLPMDVNLAPGKEFELYELKRELGSGSESGIGIPKYPTLYGTGKFHIQYERVFGNSSSGKITLDPALSKLATGKLELEVKDAEKAPQKQEPEKKEGFTAWGKEIGGLQAGLGYRPGERGVYHQGDTVTVVLRVRNVGKEAVDFKHIWAFFVENPPKITDAGGKMVQLPNYRTRAQGLHMPRSSNVAPGKEVELYEWTFALQPNGENSSRSFIHGTGKFSLQCERIVGPTWLNPDHPNPTLDKLATGKLELEIKPEAAPKDDNKANKAVNPRVSLDKTKATVEGQLDEASTLVLRIGEEKDKLFWEARRKDAPGSAMVRFSEEGAKRFWGDKAQSAGAFKAVVELSDKILMSDGKFATGFIYSVAISEGAATEKQSLIGSMIYVPIPKTGSLQDFLARSLAGDAMPFGQLSLREESKIVRKDGVVTFADIQKGDGKLVPVSFVMEKSHSSLRRKQPPPAATEKK